ncbi:hypothetical protein CPT_Merlin252 [Citrobacter phage Merlin]|uniref:Uncharacterized protein n=1 Tax=Citrobacter phage Merlin TaxID=1675602 RepID=A0A0K1LNX7_9CAUD|nr:hypothetical protein CPT_Merlin252 [Citrobacter phage Merlin]AKU43898.1 hypothetical protein CPT_Merlin252 [Citrobacter phage Merlin]
MKLELDPDVRPEFLSYTNTFKSKYGEVEVWACKTSESFGINQTNDKADEDIIVMDKYDLLNLQKLVNHAVEIMEGE